MTKEEILATLSDYLKTLEKIKDGKGMFGSSDTVYKMFFRKMIERLKSNYYSRSYPSVEHGIAELREDLKKIGFKDLANQDLTI